ncbi:MAG: lysine--tRNA ligase [Emergencia timonensis]|uniref:lysine--tRNA ligase n=1 Tax=Emergencia timonensis TaxID=1776384 RepID=UPI000833E46C|nr:lysine--tRNA ligase [Emergencia timonensis]WNX88606.1 lysine--tRNA ligase [Emergencia timonensis]
MSTQDNNVNVQPEEELSEEKLNEQRQIRREKLKKLQEAGRNPFLQETWDVTAHSMDIKDNFDAMEDQEVSCAGRIMAFRRMGKMAFIDIQDKQGRIQGVVKKDDIGSEEYDWFKTYDIGDIVGVEGIVFKTKAGEISIQVKKLVLLSKSLQVLPNKWHGLKDQDIRYRQRYTDLIMNPEVREMFIKRSVIIHEIKRVLEEDYGFLEVDTPILTTIAGGANARPFNTHHNTLDIDMKLRISNELYLKRLIVGGLDRVYEMGKMFRNEGMDRNHNPEFTSMECYMAYGNMESVMDVTEQVVYKSAMAVNGSPIIKYQGKEFDVTPPWRRLNMADAVKEITGIDFSKIDTDEEARAAAIKYGMDPEDANKWTRGKIIAEMFEDYCEDVPGYLDGPVFIVGHPVEISPLSKRDPEDPRITRRFEAYINGWEIANAFSELNDPIDQFERFTAQQAQLDSGEDDEAHPMDMDFVNALEVGLPPTGGLGVGIDRVIMLITDAPSIRDIILFPTMKPEKGDSPKKAAPQAPLKREEIDFSKVKVEPLFEEDVDFDTFSKSDFRAVKIKECEAVPKSKKLLKFVLDDGTDTDRIILSGIHEYYEPEELIGRTAIAITNLPPRKMMGIDSCGMLISAVYENDGEEGLNLLIVDDQIPAGAKLY